MLFAHGFGSSLNEHVHFHVCVVDGVFEDVAGDVIFHPASGVDETVVAQVQGTLRRRILRAFVGRGLLESSDAKDMLPTSTAASRWMPVCASKHTTALR